MEFGGSAYGETAYADGVEVANPIAVSPSFSAAGTWTVEASGIIIEAVSPSFRAFSDFGSTALDFDGVDDDVSGFSEDSAHQWGGEDVWTIGAFVEYTESGEWEHAFTFGNTWQLIIGKDSNDDLRCGYFSDSGGWEWTSVSLSNIPSSPFHLTYRRNGDTQEVLIDGSVVATTNYTTTPTTDRDAGALIAIGRSGGGRYWTGKIDSPYIYTTALTDTEVQQIARENHPTQGLVGYWPFNEGAGSTAYDYTERQNDGTIVGATWTQGIDGDEILTHQFMPGRVSTMEGDGEIDASVAFSDVFPEELTYDQIRWDFSQHYKGFVSEWIYLRPDSGHGTVSAYFGGRLFDDPIFVLTEHVEAPEDNRPQNFVPFDPKARSDEIRVDDVELPAVFERMKGEEGWYRMIIKGLEPKDILTKAIINTTHTWA